MAKNYWADSEKFHHIGDTRVFIERYNAAAKIVRGSVVDAACGCGWGTYLLGANASSVLGLDIVDNQLRAAVMNNCDRKITYRKWDLQNEEALDALPEADPEADALSD